MNFNKAEFYTSFGSAAQIPAKDRPEITFSGRSNVGKSSIINKLCRRNKLARVSATPGKTATINFYTVDTCYFVDLPGYGYAKVSNAERKRWDDLINGYLANGRRSELLCQLLDCRHSPSEDDMQMLEYLRHKHIPYIVILTKADKLKNSERESILAQFTEGLREYNCKRVFLTSAESGLGMDELAAYLNEVADEAVTAYGV